MNCNFNDVSKFFTQIGAPLRNCIAVCSKVTESIKLQLTVTNYSYNTKVINLMYLTALTSGLSQCTTWHLKPPKNRGPRLQFVSLVVNPALNSSHLLYHLKGAYS